MGKQYTDVLVIHTYSKRVNVLRVAIPEDEDLSVLGEQEKLKLAKVLGINFDPHKNETLHVVDIPDTCNVIDIYDVFNRVL